MKSRMCTINRCAITCCLVLCLGCFAVAQTYTITDLGVLSGDSASFGTGISPSGLIVGCSDTSAGNTFPCSAGVPGHAFLWSKTGGMQDLGVLSGGTFSAAYAVNDSKQVVGFSLDPQNKVEAFRWTNASGMTKLVTLPNASYSVAGGVNSHGDIGGSCNSGTSNGKIFAVLWTNNGAKIQKLPPLPHAVITLGGGINESGESAGVASFNRTFTKLHGFKWTKANGTVDLGTLPGGANSNVNGINSTGTITGYATTHAYPLGVAVIWNNSGKIRKLGTLSGDSSSAGNGINDLGQVVGSSSTSTASRAFLWTSKKGMQDLNTLIPVNSGWTLIYASSTNAKGQITGYGTVNGQNHAFLLTP
jgi:probable HAF family extracellular repeat protein